MSNQKFVVSTIYLKKENSKPITHVFGPPMSRYKAEKLRKQFLKEVDWHHPQPYFYHFSVNRIHGEAPHV